MDWGDMMDSRQKITILDFGGQYNQLIARRVREMGVYCEILPHSKPVGEWKDASLKGVILTGTLGAEAKKIEDALIKDSVPVMSIVDGRDFRPSAGEDNEGMNALKAFVTEGCKCQSNYKIEDQIDRMIQEVKDQVGDGKVIAALSGGVDSSVCAVLASKALRKDQLICVFVDHGFMRKDEPKQVVETYRDKLGLNLIHIDGEARFLKACEGVTDPEQKRKIIGETFIRVFEEEARKINAQFLLQGTIYPDILESGIDGKKSVKSHHNVGGLPKESLFSKEQLVEPVKYLFKNEVRELGTYLGIPREMLWRQPFPGPGLAVRCIGLLLKERLDLLRECDYIFRDEIAQAGLAEKIWQYFTIMTGVKTVGVHGEDRTYAECIALRAVNTEDAMTADVIELPYEVLFKTMNRIIRENPGVNRVVYDITQKPPGTIEWE